MKLMRIMVAVFVVYENIFTMKVSRFTVYSEMYTAQSCTLNFSSLFLPSHKENFSWYVILLPSMLHVHVRTNSIIAH